MSIDNANKWLTLLANFGVLAGIFLVAFELNLSTDAIRLQTAISTNQQVIDGELAFMGDSTHKAFANAVFHPSKMTDAEVGQIWAYLNVQVYSAMNIWRAYQGGLASKEDWDHAIGFASAYLTFDLGRIYWETVKVNFPVEFVRAMDSSLARTDRDLVQRQYREMIEHVRNRDSDHSIGSTRP